MFSLSSDPDRAHPIPSTHFLPQPSHMERYPYLGSPERCSDRPLDCYGGDRDRLGGPPCEAPTFSSPRDHPVASEGNRRGHPSNIVGPSGSTRFPNTLLSAFLQGQSEGLDPHPLCSVEDPSAEAKSKAFPSSDFNPDDGGDFVSPLRSTGGPSDLSEAPLRRSRAMHAFDGDDGYSHPSWRQVCRVPPLRSTMAYPVLATGPHSDPSHVHPLGDATPPVPHVAAHAREGQWNCHKDMQTGSGSYRSGASSRTTDQFGAQQDQFNSLTSDVATMMDLVCQLVKRSASSHHPCDALPPPVVPMATSAVATPTQGMATAEAMARELLLAKNGEFREQQDLSAARQTKDDYTRGVATAEANGSTSDVKTVNREAFLVKEATAEVHQELVTVGQAKEGCAEQVASAEVKGCSLNANVVNRELLLAKTANAEAEQHLAAARQTVEDCAHGGSTAELKGCTSDAEVVDREILLARKANAEALQHLAVARRAKEELRQHQARENMQVKSASWHVQLDKVERARAAAKEESSIMLSQHVDSLSDAENQRMKQELIVSKTSNVRK
ncbi:unnamed protein product, partial [Choristocarpus tenellus]